MGAAAAKESDAAVPRAPCPFDAIVEDVACEIALFAGYKGAWALAQVNRTWRRYVSGCSVWQPFLRRLNPQRELSLVAEETVRNRRGEARLKIQWLPELAQARRQRCERVSSIEAPRYAGPSLGARFSGFFSSAAPPPLRFLLLGLSGSGKSTILSHVARQQGTAVTTCIPTIGFDIEEVTYKGVAKVDSWCVGRTDKIRPFLWMSRLLENTACVLFVVDATSDRDWLERAAEELDAVMAEDELRDAAWCIVANFQDSLDARVPSSVCDALHLNRSRRRTDRWAVQGTVARDGRGVDDAFDWAVRVAIQQRTAAKAPPRTPAHVPVF